MKERTFYTINLDLKRIIFSLVMLVGLMTYFFMLGNSIGKRSVTVKEPANKEENKLSDRSLAPTSEEGAVVPPPIEDKSDSLVSEEVDLKPNSDPESTKPIPISVTDVKEDPAKKAPDTTKVATNQIVPVKKVVNPPLVKKPIIPPKTPIILEEKTFYTIQLGAFSSQEQANKFKDNVIAKNKFPGKFIPYVLKQRDFFVVRVGKSTSKEELEKIVQGLDPATQASAMIVKNVKP